MREDFQISPPTLIRKQRRYPRKTQEYNKAVQFASRNITPIKQTKPRTRVKPAYYIHTTTRKIHSLIKKVPSPEFK